MVTLHIDPRRPRESIHQVNQFIESTLYFGTLFDEQSLRTVHGVLPNVCKLIFGTECPGTSRFDFEKGHPILEFLSPTGPLCTFLLAHFSNRQWVYTILDEHLPPATSDILKLGELSSLPDMYQGRIVDVTSLPSSHSTGSLASSFSSTSTSSLLSSSLPLGPSERYIVTLNMFEYFFFYFSYTLTHPPFPSPPSRRDWYPCLVRMYLAFFVPSLAIPPPPSTTDLLPPSSSKPSGALSSSMKALVDPSLHLFNTHKVPPGTVLTPLDRLAGSKYVVGCFIENWLSPTFKKKEHQGMRSTTPAISLSIADFPYTTLSIEALQCISLLAEHISTCDLLHILDTPLPNLEFRLTSYSINLSSEKLAQIALHYTYRTCLCKLNPFFKTSIRHYPLDATFLNLMQAWIFWLTPHRRRIPSTMTLSLSKALESFVHENRSLYMDGCYLFLERASTLDYLEPMSVQLLDHVLQLYLDPRIHAYLSNEARSSSLLQHVGTMYVDFLGYLPTGMVEHVQTILHKLHLGHHHELSHTLAQLFDIGIGVSSTSNSPPFSSSTSSSFLNPWQPFSTLSSSSTSSSSSSSPSLPPVSVFDVELTQDQQLTLTGRFQLKHGLRKSPPFPRMHPGFQRDIIFSTEIPWLVSFTYSLSDYIEHHWHVRIHLRWLAERNCIAWCIVLFNLYFGMYLKSMVLSAGLILLIYLVV